MTTVTHIANKQEISAVVENPHFLLTNNCGEYLALGSPNHSNYDGFFVKIDGAYHKILANIAPMQPLSALRISDDGVMRHAQEVQQRISCSEKGVLLQCTGKSMLTLDCKRLYDESDQGRRYIVEKQHSLAPGTHDLLANLSIIKVRYEKFSDGSFSQKLYEIHVAIATTMQVEQMNAWRQAAYLYDERRGTKCTPWVYDLLLLDGNGKVAVAAAGNPEEAYRKALDLLVRQNAHVTPTLPTEELLAWRALRALQTREGIMAGLPWFFHYWSRDELIAAGGLLVARDYDAVIRILEKWYCVVRENGSLPAIYPDQGLTSSDAPGWLGKRTYDLLQRLSEEQLLQKLPKATLESWREKTGLLLDAIPMHDHLVRSEYNTTWMDTSSGDDGRAGYRIEIQALYLALHDAHAYLCTMTRTPVLPQRNERARLIIAAVHARFVRGNTLLDGLHSDQQPDAAVRPNLFLAWYVAPKLFTKQEWSGFFDAALAKLWLPWGGIASIATDHPLFKARYTGEDVASYHRGDSWYFINNIAAMAMRDVDAKYGEKVQQIKSASMRDLLFQGYCGHASELSSAAVQEASGTHAQAWSASTLLELLHRLGQ